MYFRWKDRRIVVKIAVWGTTEGRAAPFVHTLADAVSTRVDAGELEPPEERAVGVPRNGEALSVDESDRTFTMLFCHPAGEAGTFHGTPVDYKLLAPEAPVEDNRAFDSALHDASAVLVLASGDPTPDATALEAIAERTASTGNGSELAMRVVLAPEGTEVADPETFESRHDLPPGTVVEVARPWEADEAWRVFLEMTEQIRPQLRAASERGALPV